MSERQKVALLLLRLRHATASLRSTLDKLDGMIASAAKTARAAKEKP